MYDGWTSKAGCSTEAPCTTGQGKGDSDTTSDEGPKHGADDLAGIKPSIFTAQGKCRQRTASQVGMCPSSSPDDTTRNRQIGIERMYKRTLISRTCPRPARVRKLLDRVLTRVRWEERRKTPQRASGNGRR